MRRRTLLCLLQSTLLLVIFVLRCHLQELFEVARTYGTFSTWTRRHPETFYKFVPGNTTAPAQTREMTPRIIHQIYLSNNDTSVPAKYEVAVTSCQNLHSDWSHHLWTDARANEFLGEHYPEIYDHYSNYPQTIQRANILRYAVLYHYGGVYLDLDVQCLRPLDRLLHLPFLTPGAYPAGVNNAFILSRRGHKFLQHILQMVPRRDLKWGLPYVENMLSTGCMFFSNRWMSYARHLHADSVTETEDEHKTYVLTDETGDMIPHMLRGVVTTPLFHHGGSSSWHTWDAAIILLIGRHYHSVLLGLGLISSASIVLVIVLFVRRRSAARNTWRKPAFTWDQK